MKYPNINQIITTGGKSLNFLVILVTAWGLAKVCWWLVNPLGYNVPTNIYANIQNSNGIAQGIINRAPFGVIIVKKEEVEQPSIVSQIKVTGVYAGGVKNSIAFLLINSKNSIAMIGDSILGATLTAINQNGIVLSLNNQNIPINVNGSNTPNTANTPAISPANSTPQPFSGATHDNNGAPANQPPTSMAPNNNGGDGDSLAEKRRKMIEAFQHQNSGASTNNTSSNSNNDNQQSTN